MNQTAVRQHFLHVLYLRRYVLQISVGFSGTGLFRTLFRYCAASAELLPWPASNSVFRFMALYRAGFTCDIYKTHSTETTSCLVSWAYVNWYMLGRVGELTQTHTEMFWRGKKSRARFTNIQAFAWVQAKCVCQASSGSNCYPFYVMWWLESNPYKLTSHVELLDNSSSSSFTIWVQWLLWVTLKLSSPVERLRKPRRVSMCGTVCVQGGWKKWKTICH